MKRVDLGEATSLADRLDEICAVREDFTQLTCTELRLYTDRTDFSSGFDVNLRRFIGFLDAEARDITQELTKLGVEL